MHQYHRPYIISHIHLKHQTKPKRKRKQTSNSDNQKETSENNAFKQYHESSAANNRPLIDVTNSISTSQKIKSKRQC